MRRLKYTYLLAIAAMASIIVACSSDSTVNDTPDTPTPIGKEKAKISLRMSIANNTLMRATDGNATDAELMNIWVVAVVNNSTNALEHVIACKPTGTSREIDADLELPKGTEYRFYSFANMSPDNVKTLLASKGTGIAFTLDMTGVAVDVQTAATGVAGTLTATQANSIVASVNGNGFTALTSSDNNGFGSYGIPMSNVQTLTIPNSGTATVDLVVVRMMAKMTVSVKNETGAEQYIKYATISDVTGNVASNLMLLPSYTTANSANTMEFVHGDIQPNLNGTPTTTELTIPDMANTTALADNATREVTFYINECKRPTDFYLTIGLGDASSTNEYRYALIDSKGATTDDNGKWDYIARNDYRIIPIILDDMKFEIIPYDFPAIGVYPVSVSEIDNVNHIYNFTFHDYGHFHLLPVVTKGGAAVGFSATTPTGTDYKWTLIDNNWSESWFTAATLGGAWMTDAEITSNGFYRDETATADGDEVGGAPYWYVNDGVAGPQWDPAASGNYRPFVFGYIADPGSSMSEDKKIYHEMKIQVYNGTSVYRQMLYRFYMTLSADQMMYSRGLDSAPVRRHTHGY